MGYRLITLRRAGERHHAQRGRRVSWRTFEPRLPTDAPVSGFEGLVVLTEDCLPPGASVSGRAPLPGESLTYVHEGALAYGEAARGAIQAGEFGCRSTGGARGARERNASRADWAHVFTIGLLPRTTESGSTNERKRFSTAERRGRFCLVASPDARHASLGIHQDLLVYSSLLYAGRHVVHELGHGRRAWVHVVAGAVAIDGLALHAGDGIGLASRRAVSLTSGADAEILLLDFGAG